VLEAKAATAALGVKEAMLDRKIAPKSAAKQTLDPRGLVGQWESTDQEEQTANVILFVLCSAARESEIVAVQNKISPRSFFNELSCN
jgi:hypothetical protein